MKKISLIIPAYNEAESLPVFLPELAGVLSGIKTYTSEIIVIDDGSTDGTATEVKKLAAKDKKIKLISFLKNEGKALALQAGFDNAGGDIIITMDADGQDDPKEISRFLEKIDEDYDLVTGWKQERKDGLIKNKTSFVYNFFTNLLLKTKLHDSNCGFKAYRKEVAKSLNLYGELHRYIPALVEANGYRVAEIPVQHRGRKYGRTKYGPGRFLKGALDLLTVAFITKFKYRPSHIFGVLGLVISSLGILAGLYLSWLKLIMGEKIGDRPLLLLAILLIVVGVQITVTGLLGELIISQTQTSPRYRIKK